MRALTALAVFSLLVSGAAAADWPSFRGDPALTGVTADALPAEPALLWKRAAPDGVEATAAIVGDRVFAAELSGELHCLNLATGEPVWTFATEIAGNFRPGFKSSPAVAGGRVYAGDEDGFLHCLDAATGERLWRFETRGEIISSPTVTTTPGEDGEPADVVLVGSYDNRLYCVNAADGQQRWAVETQGYVHCTTAVVPGGGGAGRTFIAGCDEHLRGVEVAGGAVTLDVAVGTYLIASPAAAGGRVYFGTHAGQVLAVDASADTEPGAAVAETDAVAWRAGGESQFAYKSSAAVTDDRVFVTGGNRIAKALDRATGEERWTYRMKAGSDSSPVVTRGGGPGARVWFGGGDRTLRALDAATGEESWSQNLLKDIVASPAVGGPAGETVLVIGTTGPNGAWWCFGG